MKNILVLLLISFCFCSIATAQLFLNLEKSGSAYSERIYPGKVLTFKVTGDEDWRTAELIDLKPETNLIVFANHAHPIESIIALRSDKRLKFSNRLSKGLMTFGLSWSAYAGIGALVYEDYQYEKVDAVISGTAILTGFLVGKLLRYKTIPLKNNYRLRIIDMRI